MDDKQASDAPGGMLTRFDFFFLFVSDFNVSIYKQTKGKMLCF